MVWPFNWISSNWKRNDYFIEVCRDLFEDASGTGEAGDIYVLKSAAKQIYGSNWQGDYSSFKKRFNNNYEAIRKRIVKETNPAKFSIATIAALKLGLENIYDSYKSKQLHLLAEGLGKITAAMEEGIKSERFDWTNFYDKLIKKIQHGKGVLKLANPDGFRNLKLESVKRVTDKGNATQWTRKADVLSLIFD